MRDIEFRGFHEDKNEEQKAFYNGIWHTGKWLYGWVTTQFKKSTDGDLLTKIKSNTFGVGEHLVDTSTVCQYIGLTDANKNKIFEGDIVRYEDYIFAIDYDTNDAVYYGHSVDDEFYFYNVWALEVEVIGNIYDNPELLEIKE